MYIHDSHSDLINLDIAQDEMHFNYSSSKKLLKSENSFENLINSINEDKFR